MKYFNGVSGLDELKKEYRRLSMLHHPDRGGDIETMKAINAEHDELFEILKKQHNTAADEFHQTTETAEEFRDILEVLMKLDGLEVELCGAWLWISGNTLEHKDALKAAGCGWSSPSTPRASSCCGSTSSRSRGTWRRRPSSMARASSRRSGG